MMKLYMIRHGQSENNLTNTHSGHSMTPLTEKGIQDAKCAGKLLYKIKFDKIFSSDLPRAYSTCENALPGCEYEKTSLIREVNVGTLSDRPIKDCEAEYGDFYIKSKSVYDFTPWQGENREMTCQRAKEFLKMLEASDYKTVAAFSHGTFIEYILCIILGCAPERGSIVMNNGAVSVFEYKDCKWRLLRWNCLSEI